MSFIIHKEIHNQDVHMLAMFLAVEPLASYKAAKHTEALCSQDIHNSSLPFLQSAPPFFQVEYQIFNKA